MKNFIELHHLSFFYSGSTSPAFEDINISVHHVEFVAVIGSSGSGKSTLCYTLTGAIPQLISGQISGQVSVSGYNPFTEEIPNLVKHVSLVV